MMEQLIPTILLSGGGLLILLALSAFFSASETSLSSISKVELRQLRKSTDRTDRTIVRILADPSRMITTILIGNNIVNIWSSSIATAFAISVAGDEGVGIATAIMTVVILLFSEITPKTVAAANPRKTARKFAPAVDLVQRLLYPLVMAFSAINSFFLGFLRIFTHESSRQLTGDEIRTMVDVGKSEGILEEGEHRLLHRAFSLGSLKLREIMTPRAMVAAISIDSSLAEIRRQFRQYHFSRIPVYEGTIDSIQGMIHYKDVLFLPDPASEPEPSGRTAAHASLRAILRPVLFVPETQTPFALLEEMEAQNLNMAVVIDEHGCTDGIVTIDDVIEAVFGSIRDEYDDAGKEPIDQVQILGPDHLRVPGTLRLADLNAILKTDLDSDWFETVGGLVMETAGRFPARGDRVTRDNLEFIVEEIAGRKIQTLDIVLQTRTDERGSAARSGTGRNLP